MSVKEIIIWKSWICQYE